MNKEIISTIVDCLEIKLGETLIEKVSVSSDHVVEFGYTEMHHQKKKINKLRNALQYFEFEHGVKIADDKYLIERATPVVCHMPNIIGRGRW